MSGTEDTMPGGAEDTQDASDASAQGSGTHVIVRAGEQPDYGALTRVDPAHYVFGEEIARGGMGRILTARDRRLGRTVAIKELLQPTSTMRRRFEREARITARLQHPAIVNLLEAGTWPDGEPFYAMKLVDGEPLARAISRAGSLEERLALLPNVIAVVDALAYAHAKNVIHRDLKPSNVLVGAYGETVVIDWGLAKDLVRGADESDVEVGPHRAPEGETVAGTVLGTPAYMPPEQAEGARVDQRADVYSLGAILYHTLAGEPPYTGKHADAVLASVLDGPPPPIAERVPGLPPDLAAIVDKAMAQAPRDRYPSARELVADLKKFQTGQLVGAHRYSGWQLLRRWVRRNRRAVVVGAVAVALLAVFGITSVVGIMRERERTEQQRTMAEVNRGQAEDLMGFMLGDLGDKLEPLGKLPLLEAVARKALAYYVARPQTGDPREQHGRAVALVNIGRVFVRQGAYEEAYTELVAALAIDQALFVRDPSNADVAHGIAVAHNALADLFQRQAKLFDAMREYQSLIPLMDDLVSRDPRNEANVSLLAIGLERMGWVYRERGDLDAALANFQRSRDLRVSLDSHDPESRLAVSTGHESIGGILEIRGDLQDALTAYRASLIIRSDLVASDPTNMRLQYALARTQDRVGLVLDAIGDSDGALDVFRSELQIAERLAERDATNAEWQDLLGIAKQRIGDLCAERGDRKAALASYRDSEAIHEQALRRDPSNVEALHQLAIVQDQIGYVLLHDKDLDGALAKFESSRALREKRAALDPANPEWQREISISLDGAAEVLLARGDKDRALATYRDNLKLATRIATLDPQNMDWQRDLALAHQRVGDVLLAQSYADAALVEYRKSGEIFDALVAREPKNTSSRREVANNHSRIGNALAAGKDARGALKEYLAEREGVAALLANDPANAMWMNDLLVAHEGIAEARAALGDHDGMVEAYRDAIKTGEKLLAVQPDDRDLRAELDDLRHKIGRVR